MRLICAALTFCLALAPASLSRGRAERLDGAATDQKERRSHQNDFLIFGTVTVSSFASGALLSGVGWAMVQIAIMPFVAVAACVVLWWWWRQRAATAAPRYAGE